MPWSFTEQVAAGYMLNELQQLKLVVCKIKTDDGYVRVPICSNPDWYSKLCNGYLKSRKRYPKMRTIIKRCNTIRLLERIASGIQNEDTAYAIRIRPLLKEWLERNQI